jgi:flagellar biosynthesis GTPase FlhF
VRGFCCLCLEKAGVIRGGGSIAGREEWTLLGFFWVDAIEGNEEALQEEREKLRRRKAREERLAAEHLAQLENQRLQREAEEHEQVLRQRQEASRSRREEMQRKVQAVQRKVLTQISSRGGSSVHSLGRTFQVCC